MVVARVVREKWLNRSDHCIDSGVVHHLKAEEIHKQKSLRLNPHRTCSFHMQSLHQTLTP